MSTDDERPEAAAVPRTRAEMRAAREAAEREAAEREAAAPRPLSEDGGAYLYASTHAAHVRGVW